MNTIEYLSPLMLVGTASDVGKSTIATAFCRILKQDGYHPAPFKAQNMSLNSFATPKGFEIGRAQATQAEAAGIPCHVDMNPILLKPTGNSSSQVVLNGKPMGNQSASQYFRHEYRDFLFEQVTQAYQRLSTRYNPLVIEGAGSIAELNLKSRDIVNMRVARHVDARVILVADIDRGGVFASVYGSIKLLPPEEQNLIQGIIINKFRGDERLFEEGKQIIQEITGKPVLGVLPYFSDIELDEEDSVALERKPHTYQPGKLNICVVNLPRISNYTDFKVFERFPMLNLFYSDQPRLISQADVIILPGSKNTIEDLLALRERGIADVILAAHQAQKKVIGICGGYQMMGRQIDDPEGIESAHTSVEGLGILPMTTRLKPHKITQQKEFTFKKYSVSCLGYEIHMGETTPLNSFRPLNYYSKGTSEGCWLSNQCWGTYIHGIFDNRVVLNDLLKDFNIDTPDFDYNQYKDEQYDLLASLVRAKIDIPSIYQFLQL